MALHENLKKYIYPPTVKQIDQFIKELKLKDTEFELVYGMAHKTIARVKCGYRNLPIKHWNIFYEKIKPSFEMVINKNEQVRKRVRIKPSKKTEISKLKKNRQ